MNKQILPILALLIALASCRNGQDPFEDYSEAWQPIILGDGSLSRDSLQWNNAFSKTTSELFYTKSYGTSAALHKFEFVDGTFIDKGDLGFPRDALYSDVFVDQKGGYILFASNMLESSKDTIWDWNIWKSTRLNGQWQTPEPYFSQSMPGNEFYPTLAANGNIYYTITPQGSQNGDIFVSEFVEGRYGAPKPLPISINSLANEGDAFVAPDESYIIFAAFDREQGLGKSDLFISLKDDKGHWLSPVWLGRDINSEGYDGSPFVTEDGKYLLFTSSRGSTDEQTFFNHYIVRFDLEKYRKDTQGLQNYLSLIGETPQRFAPGIVSRNTIEFGASLCFASNTFYFSLEAPDLSDRTIMWTVFEEGKFKEPRPLSNTLEQDGSDVQISPDGQTLFFKLSGAVPGDALRKDGNIWQSNRLDGKWREPVMLSDAINSGNDEFYPMPTHSGNLYFSRQQSEWNRDIYRSTMVEGSYTEAVRLPDHINTEFMESGAYVAPDESFMVFARMDAVDGTGLTDLFIAFNQQGRWTEPIPLKALNSNGFDENPYVSPDGNYLFFTSNRDSDHPGKRDGQMDIYAVRFDVRDWS